MDEPEFVIVIEFSGWLTVYPKEINFQYIGGSDKKLLITGEEWKYLSREDRDDYIPESLKTAMLECKDLEYDSIKVTLE